MTVVSPQNAQSNRRQYDAHVAELRERVDETADRIAEQEAAVRGLHNGHQLLTQQLMDALLASQRLMDKVDAQDLKIAAIQTELGQNTKVTTEVRDYLEAFRGGFKVLGWLGTGLKWLSGVAVAVLALWGAWKTATGGGLPK